MDTLLWRFRHFIKITKTAKNAIFQFSTRFLKIFQSTLVGLLYLIKNVKPSSTRTCPKLAWWLYPRLSNSPRKVYPMWRDSRYVHSWIKFQIPLKSNGWTFMEFMKKRLPFSLSLKTSKESINGVEAAD